MRTLLKLYIIDKLEYDEIREKLNLKIPDMSNIITEALRRIDFYRYGITEKENISIDDLEDFSKYYSDILTPLQLRVIYLRKIEFYDNIETAKMLNITKNEVNNIISRFNRLYKKYKIKDIKVDEKDVLKEIRTHISESVIEDFDKELLSFKYGLKTKFNPDGKKLSNEEIANKYNLSLCVVIKKLYLLIDDIKAKKAGYLKNELLFIERRKLDEILDDPRLPISDKERDIICYLFELKGYPYKNIDEIVKIFNYNVRNNAKIRYKRAILSIYKYLNNEIPPRIDFELDVFPNLKYFSKRDELFLIEYFKNKLSIKDISEKYNLSYDVAYNLINRLNDSVLEIINNPNTSKFDFEFYRKQKDNPKLPFYGNLELMKSVFDLYFGENNTNCLEIPEIVKELNIQNASSTLLNTFKNYILSFYELKDGIEKIKCFTSEEIIDYYNTHYENISENDLRNFEIYFKRKNSSIINGSNTGISYQITANLLKEKYPNYFNLATSTKEEFLKIFKKYHKQLLKSIKLYLMAYYGIRERDFMNGKDLNHVYRILNKLTYHKVNKRNDMTLSRKLDE